jgi:hypothetical protein
MSADLEDFTPLLARLTPRDLVAYLERRGWERFELAREAVVEYRSPADPATDFFPVLLPRQRDLFDYTRMVTQAIRAVADFESRPPLDVVMQMMALQDVFKTRVASFGADDGTIRLDQVIELTGSVRDLLIYSASSELRTARFFPRRLREATELARNCKFGQTEFGSFVATFYLPLPANQQERLFEVNQFPDPVPLARRTLTRIMRGLEVVNVASETGDYRVIAEHFENALNANMCDALADIVEETTGDALEFSIAMDPVWAIPDVPNDVIIQRRAFPLIQEAARELRGPPELRRVTVEGWVYQLQHEGPLAVGTDYQIRVLWEDVDGTYKIKVSLTPDEYEMAIEAHRTERPVRVSGELERIGRYWILMNPQDFTLA